MKTIKVVAAVIKAVNEGGEQIVFATQRGYGEFKGGLDLCQDFGHKKLNYSLPT